jgi:hypothetical protein
LPAFYLAADILKLIHKRLVNPYEEIVQAVKFVDTFIFPLPFTSEWTKMTVGTNPAFGASPR